MPITEMKRLNVYLLSTDEKQMIERLMQLRCVQIDELEPTDGLTAAEAPPSAAIEASLSAAREAISILSRFSSYRRRANHLIEYSLETVCRDGTLDRARETVSRTVALWSELEEIAAKRRSLQETVRTHEPFIDCPLSPWKENVKSEHFLLGAFPKKLNPLQIEDALMTCNATVEELCIGRRERYCKVSFFPEREGEAVKCLQDLGFVKAEIDTDGRSVEETILACESEISKLEDRQALLDGQIRELTDGLFGVEILCDLLATDLEINRYLGCLVRTEACSVLTGWIPGSQAERVAQSLSEVDCAYEIEDPTEGEIPPIFSRASSKRAKNGKRNPAAFEPAAPIEFYSVRQES